MEMYFQMYHPMLHCHIYFILLSSSLVPPQSLYFPIGHNRAQVKPSKSYLLFHFICIATSDNISFEWHAKWIMSSIPRHFGKSNCSAFSTFIWIITWPWCEFSLLASSTRVLVQVILPTFSHSSPFSSYWISMVVEIQISLWGIKHTENCDRAIYYFKVVSSRMNQYLFKKGINNVLLSWFFAP